MIYEGVAFVVGVSEYDDQMLSNLNCPAKDATDFAKAMTALKYDVICSINETKEQADEKWHSFKSKMTDHEYDTAIVFFSGHGAHVNESECLLMKDAKHIERSDDSRAKGKSLLLKDLMDELDHLEVPKKIFIIDACRTKVNAKGPANHMGIRPSEISRQSFVAYATANGETAQDGNSGQNSVFTEAVLEYIAEENLPVESLFKKVRLRLVEKAIDQTPWEHTCLIDEFAFNHGQLSKYYNLPYSEQAFKYDYYKPKSDLDAKIIEVLKDKRPGVVKQGIQELMAGYKSIAAESLFVIGRLVAQLAADGNGDCMKLASKPSRIKAICEYCNGDFLRGIYYQLYFDGKDNLRDKILGTPDFLDAIEQIRTLIGNREAEQFVSSKMGDDMHEFNYRIDDHNKIDVVMTFENTGVEIDKGSKLMQMTNVQFRDDEMDPQEVIPANEAIVDSASLRERIITRLNVPRQLVRMIPPLSNPGILYTSIDIDRVYDELEYTLNTNLDSATAYDVDILSSNSYIEEVSEVMPNDAALHDSNLVIKGNCKITVHMEYDRDEHPSKDIPAAFEAIYHNTPGGLRIFGATYTPDPRHLYA